MGRKRKADAIDSVNDTGKDSEITNGTGATNNDTMLSSMASGQQPVTAAKTSAAIVVATPGSNIATDQKSKVKCEILLLIWDVLEIWLYQKHL